MKCYVLDHMTMKPENKQAQIPVCPVKVAIATTIAQWIVLQKTKDAMEERVGMIAKWLIFVTQQKSFALPNVLRMKCGALAHMTKVDLSFVYTLRMDQMVAQSIAQLNVAKMRNGVLEERMIWVVKCQNHVLQLIVS